MIRSILVLSLLIGAPVSGFAQTGSVSGATVTASGSAISRTLAARAADVFGTKDFGAVCDGSHHSVSGSLGVSTISGLAAYSPKSGGTPYSWVNNGTWSAKVALPMSVAANSGATTLYFDSALQVPVGATVTGTQIAGSTTVSAVSNPGTVTQVTNGATSTVGTKSITVAAGTATPVGSHPIPQPGLSSDDYVVSSTTTNITLKYGITAASIGTGTTLTFRPPSSVVINNGITANKPSVQSAASTPTVNYFVYFAWPLTDAMVAAAEMDWLGTQAAIEAATAAANGGKVQAPSGSCVMDNATVSGNALGGLVVHEATVGSGLVSTKSVDIVGQGLANTLLTWPSEMGAGRVAISYGVPYATFDNGAGHYGANFYYGVMENLALIGPSGQGASAVGTVPTWTTGIVSGSRRELNNIDAFGFYVGATFENIDHTRWSNVSLGSNAMNLRVGAAGNFLYGDNVIDHLELSGGSLANWSLDKDAFFISSNISTLYCGSSPKCIRFEPGAPDSYGQPTGGNLLSSTIGHTNAELTGICVICDDNYGPNGVVGASIAGGELQLVGMEFDHFGFSMSSGNAPAGSPVNFFLMLPIAYSDKFYFDGFPSPSAGMQAAVFVDLAQYGPGGDLFSGNMTSILANMGATPFFAWYGIPFGQGQYYLHVEQPGRWSGHAEVYGSATSAAQFVPLEYAGSGFGSDMTVQRSGGSAPFGGVNMTTAPAQGGSTIVATKICSSGAAGIVLPTSGTASALHWAKLATGGTITNATNANTSGEVVIGTIMQVSGSSARVNIGQNGSCD